MPKRHNKNKNQTKIQSIERKYNPATTQDRIYYNRTAGYGNLASNGIGFLAAAITMDPSIYGTDWASFAALYDEFRVVGVRLTLCSLQQYSVTVANNLLAIVYDNDSGTAPSSFGALLEYPTVQYSSVVFQHSAQKENQTNCQQFSWARPVSGNNTSVVWCDVATPAQSLGSIMLAADTLPITTTYLRFVVEYFIEFRGRR